MFFRFRVLTSYVLHSEVIHVAVCTRREAKTDLTMVKLTARIVIELH